jgi:RNA polymerase sigma factor (TIGR02999 family)
MLHYPQCVIRTPTLQEKTESPETPHAWEFRRCLVDPRKTISLPAFFLCLAGGRVTIRPAGAFLRKRPPPMSEVTRILCALEQGDQRAAAQLLPLIYDELRKLAAQKLAQEKPGQTLQATALVHEAYLRLVNVDEAQKWNGRGHFFAAAAEAMRRILVEQARRRQTAKRGGQLVREELHEADIAAPEPGEDVVALHEALEAFEALDQRAATLVKLRFFAGLDMTASAEALGISVRSAYDLWAYARAWLHRKMRPG